MTAPLLPPTREFLRFLQRNPAVRSQVRAAPDKTLLYAGVCFRPVWKELVHLKLTNAQVRDKEVLPDVLKRIHLVGAAHHNLFDWVQELDKLEPWSSNGFIAWRALSGLFAANAEGAVSFYVGSDVTRQQKVFAATEAFVLSRNPKTDALTQDALAYYLAAIRDKRPNLNFGLIRG